VQLQERESVITGLIACGDDGKVHVRRRNSHANHSFGAAALRDQGTGAVTVTLYTEVKGNRVGALQYSAQEWDDGFITPLVEAAQDGIGAAYMELDRLVKTFGHRSLSTLVQIDANNSDEFQQVVMVQKGNDGSKRMISDSIRAFRAFLTAAQSSDRPFSSESLLRVTEFVPARDYFVSAPT
jgi:hypothetical protein